MKIIKITLLLPAILLGVQLFGQANAIDKYFQQYVDDDRFTVVYVSARMLDMFDNFSIDDMDDEEAQALREVAKDLQGLRILTTEENAAAFYREAKQKINTSEYEVLMTVRDKDNDNVEFLIKEEGNVVTELLLLAGGEDSFALISLVGRIDLEKVSRLANEMEKKKE